MPARHFETIVLDYGEAGATPKLIDSLSTIVCNGRFLWSAADEGRTIECLKMDGDRYTLHRQVRLDHVFTTTKIPGEETNDEIDIELIDIAGGRLWICGSHCRVREKPDKDKPNVPKPEVIPQPSRCLFGSVDLKGNGGALANGGQTLPFERDGSLRDRLAKDRFLSGFMDLPSKENGFDIEGMVVVKNKALFGLRGPLIGSFAVVMEVPIKDGLRIHGGEVMHFLDLDGLGVRDLARRENDLLVLAGPVSSADGPFRIYRWKPRKTDTVQDLGKPILDDWTKGSEHPEGMCRLDYRGAEGILILYDSPDHGRRIRDNCYIADWFRLPH